MTLNRPSFVSTAVRCADCAGCFCAVRRRARKPATAPGSRAIWPSGLPPGAPRRVRVIVSRRRRRGDRDCRRGTARASPSASAARRCWRSRRTRSTRWRRTPRCAHLSGDVPVRRLMAVTTAGDRRRPGLARRAGRARGTDGQRASASRSSIRGSPVIRPCSDRVVAAVDFTGRNGARTTISTVTAPTSRASSPARPTPGMRAWRRARTSSTCRS